jgi:hypothetical protein
LQKISSGAEFQQWATEFNALLQQAQKSENILNYLKNRHQLGLDAKWKQGRLAYEALSQWKIDDEISAEFAQKRVDQKWAKLKNKSEFLHFLATAGAGFVNGINGTVVDLLETAQLATIPFADDENFQATNQLLENFRGWVNIPLSSAHNQALHSEKEGRNLNLSNLPAQVSRSVADMIGLLT